MLVLSSEGAVVSVYNVGQCSVHRRGNIIISSMLCSSLIGLCKGILYGCQYLHWTDRIIIKVSSQSSLSAACPPSTHTDTHWHAGSQTAIFTITFEWGRQMWACTLTSTYFRANTSGPPTPTYFFIHAYPRSHTHTPNQHHPHQIPRFSSSKLFHAVKLRQRQIRTMHMSLKAVWQS